jgi:hypothetical protein
VAWRRSVLDFGHTALVMRILRPAQTVWCAAVLGLLLSACGSGSTPTAASSSAASSSAAKGSAASSGAAVRAPSAGGTHFCQVVQQQEGLLQGTQVVALIAGGSPAAWKAYLDKVNTMNQELVDSAPPEIRPSLRTLHAAALQLRATLAAAGYDVSKVGSAKLLQTLQTKERVEATATLVRYVKTSCGIDLARMTG